MRPTVDAVASEYRDSFIVARLDIDANRETNKKYGGNGIPAYVVFRNGEVIGSLLGAMPKLAFQQRILNILE